MDDYSGKQEYTRWILRCNRHDGCQAKRSISAATTAVHGALEPLCYLIAWRDLDVASGTRDEHVRGKRPSAEHVRAAVAMNPGGVLDASGQRIKLVEPRGPPLPKRRARK